ncbi:helix-turn-helix transcriptional regulator [Pseudoalteromonas sp. 0303]|nr:helix-turn-helix transcriptional regulator [Pseudoalteromonas sp. 0303]
MKLITIILCLAIGVGCFMIARAIVSTHQNSKAKVMFTMMMLGFISLLLELALFEENIREWKVYVLSFSGPLSASIPIFFYLFFKSSVRLNSEFNKNDLKHLLLPLIYLALMLPYNVLDYQEKIEFLDNTNRSWLLSMTPMRFTRFGIIATIGVFYFQLIWRELHTKLNQKKTDVLREITKLKTALISMCVCISLVFVFFLIRLPGEFTWALSIVTIAMLILASIIYEYLPVLGHPWSQASTSKSYKEPLNVNDFQSTEQSSKFNKAYRSSVTNKKASEVICDLTALLETGIYKDASISLKLLASQLNLSTHHLSQIINQQTQGNYYELVNMFRITEAKRLLSETDMAIIDIAYEVGFNSKSSFYTEFKKHSDQTPGQYKKLVRSQKANEDSLNKSD